MSAARACFLAVSLAMAAMPGLAVSPREESASPILDIEAFDVAGGVGSLIFPWGSPERRTPVVIVLPDGLGNDGRAGRYVDQLLGADLAVLELLVGEEVDLLGVITKLATHPRLRAGQVALMGFGAGARLVAEWPGAVRARALLYPGCASLTPASMVGEAVLLMYGGADRLHARADCEHIATQIITAAHTLRWRVLDTAGYAWDRPSFSALGRDMFPAPDGSGRIAVAPWPELAALSAAEVAGFFATSLLGQRP